MIVCLMLDFCGQAEGRGGPDEAQGRLADRIRARNDARLLRGRNGLIFTFSALFYI